MKLKVTVYLDNEAFELYGGELSRVLTRLNNAIEAEGYEPGDYTAKDTLGQPVAYAELTTETLYTRYYCSEDMERDTWSVYREKYLTADHDDPIDGTQERIETGYTDWLTARARVETLHNLTNGEPTP